jgi:hypothetical protein
VRAEPEANGVSAILLKRVMECIVYGGSLSEMTNHECVREGKVTEKRMCVGLVEVMTKGW